MKWRSASVCSSSWWLARSSHSDHRPRTYELGLPKGKTLVGEHDYAVARAGPERVRVPALIPVVPASGAAAAHARCPPIAGDSQDRAAAKLAGYHDAAPSGVA